MCPRLYKMECCIARVLWTVEWVDSAMRSSSCSVSHRFFTHGIDTSLSPAPFKEEITWNTQALTYSLRCLSLSFLPWCALLTNCEGPISSHLYSWHLCCINNLTSLCGKGGRKNVKPKNKETVSPRNISSYIHELLPTWLTKHDLDQESTNRPANVGGWKLLASNLCKEL